jgi:hypothetical protein
MGRLLRIIQFRLIWSILLLLAAFVIFFEFIADVGGSANPQPSPTQPVPTAAPSPTASPSATPRIQLNPLVPLQSPPGRLLDR